MEMDRYSSAMTEPPVLLHITSERRIGPYQLSSDEHRLLSELLDQQAEGFTQRYADRLSDLHTMEVPLGQAQMLRWYATDGDADSQVAVDALTDLVGDAIDSHY
jgi:hypothetical protein